MNKKNLFIVLALAAVVVHSCQKSAETLSDENIDSNLKAALANMVSTNANEISSEDIQSVALCKSDSIEKYGPINIFPLGGPGHFKFDIPRISSCATVTVSSSTYPKTITIDYGTGCTNGKGHTKSGKIIIEISDSIVVAGAVKTITTENFYIDSMKIDLSASWKNMGKNDAGNWVIERNYNQKITQTDGDVIVEEFTDIMEWLSGFETIEKSDDSYYKSGSGSISVNDSITFSRVITEPLLKDSSCRFITKGIVELTKGTDKIVIDYGDGTCDNKATVTTNGSAEEIDLKTYHFNENGRFEKHRKGWHHGHREFRKGDG
jgi:hypothetical protein